MQCALAPTPALFQYQSLAFYSPIDRPAGVINGGVKLRLTTCESMPSADKLRLDIGLV